MVGVGRPCLALASRPSAHSVWVGRLHANCQRQQRGAQRVADCRHTEAERRVSLGHGQADGSLVAPMIEVEASESINFDGVDRRCYTCQLDRTHAQAEEAGRGHHRARQRGIDGRSEEQRENS